DRPDVETARRRRRDEELRAARELAGEDDLLQIAAGQLAGLRVRAGRCDAVAADQLDCAVAHRAQAQERPARRMPLAVSLQREVGRDAEARREAGAESVLRNV